VCIFVIYIHHFPFVCLSVTVKWLAVKTASEMSFTVSGGALNSAQSNVSNCDGRNYQVDDNDWWLMMTSGGPRRIVSSYGNTTVHLSSSCIGYDSLSMLNEARVDSQTPCSMQRTLHRLPQLTAKVCTLHWVALFIAVMDVCVWQSDIFRWQFITF